MTGRSRAQAIYRPAPKRRYMTHAASARSSRDWPGSVPADARHPHLAEDPGNLAAAHLVCNQTAYHREVRPDLGPALRGMVSDRICR